MAFLGARKKKLPEYFRRFRRQPESSYSRWLQSHMATTNRFDVQESGPTVAEMQERAAARARNLWRGIPAEDETAVAVADVYATRTDSAPPKVSDLHDAFVRRMANAWRTDAADDVRTDSPLPTVAEMQERAAARARNAWREARGDR